MLILALLLATRTSPPSVPSDEVVVTGRRPDRLRRLRMTTARDRVTGATRCVLRRRSGDAALDAAVCDAVLACVPTVSTVEAMRACVAPTMDSLVASGIGWQAEAATDGR